MGHNNCNSSHMDQYMVDMVNENKFLDTLFLDMVYNYFNSSHTDQYMADIYSI
jgi:hypothetical protein